LGGERTKYLGDSASVQRCGRRVEVQERPPERWWHVHKTALHIVAKNTERAMRHPREPRRPFPRTQHPLPSLASSMQAANRRRSKYRQGCRLYCRPKMQRCEELSCSQSCFLSTCWLRILARNGPHEPVRRCQLLA